MKRLPGRRIEAKAHIAPFEVIDSARRAFEIAGPGCLVRISEEEPRYATVAEIATTSQAFHLLSSDEWTTSTESSHI
jgi:hypothetical protein